MLKRSIACTGVAPTRHARIVHPSKSGGGEKRDDGWRDICNAFAHQEFCIVLGISKTRSAEDTVRTAMYWSPMPLVPLCSTSVTATAFYFTSCLEAIGNYSPVPGINLMHQQLRAHPRNDTALPAFDLQLRRPLFKEINSSRRIAYSALMDMFR